MFSVAWFSCARRRSAVVGLDTILANQEEKNTVAVISQGDTPYTNSSYGVGSAADSSSTAADMLSYHTNMATIDGYSELLTARAAGSLLFLYQWDDHELPENNAVCDYTEWGASTGAADQDATDTIWINSLQAYLDVLKNNTDYPHSISGSLGSYVVSGNPVAASAPQSANAAASNFPNLYFKIDLDIDGALTSVSGRPVHTRICFPDTVGHRDPLNDTDDANKFCIPAAEETQLLADINDADPTFVIVSSPKKTREATSDNGDLWSNYQTQLTRIESGITRTGVMWISGDRHVPHVINKTTSPEHCNVVACPINVDVLAAPELENDIVWRGYYMNYGLLEIEKDKITVTVRHIDTGHPMTTWELLPENNYLTKPEVKAA